MTNVQFAKAFRRHVDCPDVAIPASAGSTVGDVLATYFDQHPAVRTYLLDDVGALRRHVTVFLDDNQLTHLDAMATTVSPDGTIHVFQALSGG